MILLWSPHASGPAARVITYLLEPEASATVGGLRETVRRDPPPELLRGDPWIVGRMIDGLEFGRRYTCATFSFAATDVDTVMWRRGDPETRARVDAAIDLWVETAYPGIAPEARPPVLVGGHLHAGRLEINVLAPAYLMLQRRGRRVPRAFNVAPPRKRKDDPWGPWQDAVNHAYGWRDPRDARHAAPVRGPSCIEKRVAALDRWADGRRIEDSETAARIAAEDPGVQLLLAARILARRGAARRDDLIDGLGPVLRDLGWIVDRVSDEAVHLTAGDGMPGLRARLVLRGTLCRAVPRPPDPVAIMARTRARADAADRLAVLSAMHAEAHVLRFPGLPTVPPPDPVAILRDPRPPISPVAVRLRRLVVRLLTRIAETGLHPALHDALGRWCRRTGGFAEARHRIAALAALPPIPRPNVTWLRKRPAPTPNADTIPTLPEPTP